MTDPELILKKLALIETCVRELRELARPEHMASDIRERRFVEHTLQVAVQATIGVAAHIVADRRLGEPSSRGKVFELVERAGWLAPDLSTSLRRMTGFRNVLVHGYDDVDLEVVHDILEHRLEDLLAFASAMRSRIARESG